MFTTERPMPLIILTVVWLVALLASGIAPYDRPTWFMEVAPAGRTDPSAMG